MTDAAGQELHPHDWVAYSTRSWGQHYLKFGKVFEIVSVPRPRDRYFQTELIIESYNINGKRYTASIDPGMVLRVTLDQVPEYMKRKFYDR